MLKNAALRITSKCLIFVLLLVLILSIKCEKSALKDEALLLIRCDDIGMCHAVNQAVKEVVETGIPFSASVMFTCPWYQEAVEILKDHPNVSVGIHLTLNAEWKSYRWGPVSGSESVPSLVDKDGYFFPSRKLFFDNEPNIVEIEKELRAQIERALQSGVAIDYVDHHMGTAVSTPELRLLLENITKEYHLGISRYYGETDIRGLYNSPIEKKTDALLSLTDKIAPDQLNLMVFHIGLDTQEMSALVDLNEFGLKEMSRHRESELKALTSRKFLKNLKDRNVKLINYRDLIANRDLEDMTRPQTEY